MMRNSVFALAFAAAILLSGCASQRASEAAGSGTAAADSNADTGDLTNAGEVGADDSSPGPSEGLLAKRIIYFDYDRAEIRPADLEVVSAHARYLAANSAQHVRLEGHADERGTREYNIGLGERRAQAVRRALMLQGVRDEQLATVSYGEERPAVFGDGETVWAQNRRVEIVYLK
ncbi:MAG: peptidoglycan-associated lipoprotein Pal [Steroidobacteraceae bacterium]